MKIFTRNIDDKPYEIVMEVETELDETMFHLLTRELLFQDRILKVTSLSNNVKVKQIAFSMEQSSGS